MQKALALKVAAQSIKEFLSKEEMDVYLVVFDKSSFLLGKKLLFDVKEYIDENYISEFEQRGITQILNETENIQYFRMEFSPSVGLDSLIVDLDESFSPMLLRLIKEKGKTDVQVYKWANIDRRLFSKIKNDKNYKPSKKTVISFAIALELSLDEKDVLLKRAGFILSHTQVFDVKIEYFIIKNIYDIFAIN